MEDGPFHGDSLKKRCVVDLKEGACVTIADASQLRSRIQRDGSVTVGTTTPAKVFRKRLGGHIVQ